MKYCWRMVIVVTFMMFLAIASSAPSADQCKKERRLAINTCKSVLYGRLPSPSCCQRIRVSHIKCICSVITPKLAALIDVNRFIKLIEGCGRRVPHHFKCGSLTIP
ncbi:putative bifunctional inhibitor/plant lipid transfer protein/seed storage helical [Helianthus anomalus]